MIHFIRYQSPVGLLTVASQSGHIIGLWIEGQKYFAKNVKEPMVMASENPDSDDELPDYDVLIQARQWLDRYFAGEKPSPRELPLRPEGSGFRQRVWDILCRIPYGQTVTYGEIAKQLAADQIPAKRHWRSVGMETRQTTAAVCDGTGASDRSLPATKAVSARAVGGAVGHNPISIIIPCHRVIGAGGNLTGYAGGVAVKQRLLELEGADTSGFIIPKKEISL